MSSQMTLSGHFGGKWPRPKSNQLEGTKGSLFQNACRNSRGWSGASDHVLGSCRLHFTPEMV